jgi:hypothetical protein
VAIISIAQHAKPNVIGQMLDSLAQFIACSSVVVTTFSSKRPSIQVICFLGTMQPVDDFDSQLPHQPI